MDRFTLHVGDCREVMAAMDAESVDAIVSDPPYGLSFMGKGWDHGVPGDQFWREALRVAKPGAHLVAFGGTRTYHRLACAIEDAGWEIRDCLMWVYGSGFPKSHDVSKAMDKAAGVSPDRVTVNEHGSLGGLGKAGWNGTPRHLHYDTPKTDLARQWDGWGTALKPAWEPIILARKPLVGTVAANVARYGTGALNVDGCRVDGETIKPRKGGFSDSPVYGSSPGGVFGGRDGRWPANVVHDGSQMVLDLFPVTGPAKRGVRDPNGSMGYHGGASGLPGVVSGHEDNGGSAARFFYCAKASKADRDAGLDDMPEATPGQRTERAEGSAGVTAYAGGRGPARNIHPTVKPTDLMRWLVRMVTPPGGMVLDPFMGSGSTGKAAMLEGMRFVGIDITPEYLEIARRRIGHAAREGGDGA